MESIMRSTCLALLLVTLLAAPVLAQDPAGGAPQHPFSQEEAQQLGALAKAYGEAFSFKKYSDALDPLRKELAILLAAYERLKNGETDLGDKTEMWTQLIQVGRQGVPGIAPNYYNQACCLSKLGQTEEAIEALTKAMHYNYLDIDHMKMDEDLDPIREDPRYKALLKGINYNDVFEVYAPEGLGETAAPLIVYLHERGGSETKALAVWKALADKMKAILVVPRGPITGGFDHYAWQRYTEDEAAVRKVTETMTAVKASHNVELTKIYPVGDKQDAKIATVYALMHPDVVAGIVALNGYWNKYYYADFLDKAKAAGLKICMIHGKEDPGFARTGDGVKQLEEKGIPAKLVEFDGGKKLPDNVVELVAEALGWMAP
jgi:predicted esterase